MPALQEVSESLIRQQIARAIPEVFKTMLRIPAAFCHQIEGVPPAWPPPSVPGGPPVRYVVGTVGFIGDISGLIYLYFEEPFANHCTGSLLGMTSAELAEAGPETVNDAVGELTNMIVGVFKNGLCDCGYACKLTIPSILRGSDFRVAAAGSARRHLYKFDAAGHCVVADVLMKTDDTPITFPLGYAP